MTGDDKMPESESRAESGPAPGGPYHGTLSEGLDRAVKLAREVLKERGLSEEEIDLELGKVPQPRPKQDPPL